MTELRKEAGKYDVSAFTDAYPVQIRIKHVEPNKRPFFPRVSRLNPAIYHGDRWVIDGRSSERYTPKTWRMCVHYFLALVFG